MKLDFLLSAYEYYYRTNFTPQKKNWLVKSSYNAVAIIIKHILRLIIVRMNAPKVRLPKGSGIIVSVSSFPKRFPILRYMLISVLRQSVKPERIVVNLTCEECPKGQQDIPAYLLDLMKYGVEYKIRPVNLRPHNKYFYVLQEYSGKDIITLDDDVFYRNDVIKRLVDLYSNNQDCVCANQVRCIQKNEAGDFKEYSAWNIYNNVSRGHHLLALGVGGVLYPAGLLHSDGMFNEEDIINLCLNADDLWLKAHEVLSGVEVVTGDFTAPNLNLSYGESSALSSDNVARGRNNQLWNALDRTFNLKDKIPSPCSAKQD